MSERIPLSGNYATAVEQLTRAKHGDVFYTAGWLQSQISSMAQDALTARKDRNIVFTYDDDGPSTRITVSDVTKKPEPTVTFPTGAVRSTDSDDVRYDLIPPEALRRLAARYAMGAAKYGDNNWQKGFPVGVVINHLQNHLERWKTEGCISDDNLAAAAWGLFSLMWYEKHKPELLKEAGVPVEG